MKLPIRHLPAAALAVILAAILTAPVTPASAQLVLNEILADPATDWDGDGVVDYMGDEWIEVRNTGATTIDLSEYWLRDGLGDNPHLHLSGSLAPDAVRVFLGSEAVAWQESIGQGATGFSLNNGGDTVELLRNVYENGDLQSLEVVDGVVYQDHVAEDDRALGWDPAEGWILLDALHPYSGSTEPLGTGCAPTPGMENDCSGLVSLQRSTLDALKAAFR